MQLVDRDAWIAIVVSLLLGVGGAVLALVANGTAEIIGAALAGIAAAILLGVFFYLTGRSEDLDRMRRHPHG